MNEEVRLATDKLKKQLGDDAVAVVTTDNIADFAADNDVGVVVLTMDKGNFEEAMMAAQAANKAVEANPKVRLMFGINGLMDDKREIDEIPLARSTLVVFVSHLRRATFHRFTAEHQALMLVAAGLGKREGTQLHVPTELMNVEGDVL